MRGSEQAQRLKAWCAVNYVPPEVPIVQCPFCSHQIPEKWQRFISVTDADGSALQEPCDWVYSAIPAEDGFINVYVYVNWMKCHNDKCGEVIVRISKLRAARTLSRQTVMSDDWKKPLSRLLGIGTGESWIALPRKTAPRIDPLVPEPYARNYREAWTILDDCHRMSAVLARTILGDLLAEFAGLKNWNLEEAIAAFIVDSNHPKRLRENMDYLRVLGNIGAHTKTAKSGEILESTKEEAEWALNLIADLFDYFIVIPAKDKEMRESFTKRLTDAGRDKMLPKNPQD